MQKILTTLRPPATVPRVSHDPLLNKSIVGTLSEGTGHPWQLNFHQHVTGSLPAQLIAKTVLGTCLALRKLALQVLIRGDGFTCCCPAHPEPP